MAQSRGLSRWLPLILLFAFLLIIDFMGPRILEWAIRTAGGYDDIVMIAWIGSIIGQIAFGFVIGGLLSRNWIVGLLAGTALISLAVGATVLGANVESDYVVIQVEFGWAVFLVPIVMLCGALPFYLTRYWRGEYLTRKTDDARMEASGTEQIFIVMAIVAASLYIARVPQVAFETSHLSYWLSLFVSIMWTLVLSFLIIAPITLRSFRATYFGERLRTQLGIPLLCAVVLCLLMALFSWLTTATMSAGGFGYLCIGIATASLILIGGVESLRFAGFRLAKAIRVPRGEGGVRTTKVRQRILAGVFLLGTVVANFGLSAIETTRYEADVASSQVLEQVSATGGTAGVQDRSVISLTLGNSATDATLERFTHLKSLQHISLSDSRITDDGLDLLQAFPNLKKLELSRTEITSAAVAKIKALETLESVSVDDTSLTFADVEELLDSKNLRRDIDLSNLNLNIKDLTRLPLGGICGRLGLRGLGLTDSDVVELVASDLCGGVSLDFSDNPIQGACVGEFTRTEFLTELRLDNTELTDAALGKGLQNGPQIQSLHFSNTQLTKAILPLIAGARIQQLHLGDGQITGQDLASVKASFSKLGLHSRQFTGACFRDWKPSCYRIDMSGSGLSDETITNFYEVTNCMIFDFSNTEISDASLSAIGQFYGKLRVDLSNTQVTAAGLLEGDLRGFSTVIVAPGQFSPLELRQVRKQIAVVEGKPAGQ